MVQLASTASNYIRYLLQSLNHSNSDSVFRELLQCAAYGTEGSILVLGICFDHLNIYGKDLKNLQLEPVFASIFKYLLDKPNFSTVFFKSVRDAAICEEFLENLCTALQLTVYEKIGVGIALSYVEDVDIEMCGKKFFMIQLGELLSTRMSVDSVKIVQNMAPGLNWGIIIENLDHEGFYVPNESSFSFLMSMYRRACQDPFPLHAICGSVWKNADGQLSFLRYAVLAPPELFTFAHSGRQLAYVDAVKEHKLQPGHANHAWLCLDLLEVFCQLAERGHASLIRCILEYPLKHCPEVLLLGLAHINTAYNLLQHEISSIAFPTMLKSTLGTRMILYLWNVNPSILLRGVMDAMKDDPDNINKVLDACQELKILSPVLDMIPYSFGIRLAALASHKEFIDLGKWLSTNLRTYKDNFCEECLKFIKEVLFSVQDDSTNHFHPPNALLNSYLETVSMFVKVLQSCTGSVSSFHLSEELEKLNLTCMNSNSSLENIAADSNDIEASANSYFKLLFTEQLTIESMIQILGRFKESSEKREKSLFGVMIANLFEEYKFFPKYPENHLKTAAIIFGSLIKHHLVTHIDLKITLKAVLDALQEPADTIMFGFGTLALEQFEDCLIELPEFCHHISQISHLRAAKPELIQFIEHELASVSMVNSELDEGKNYITTQFPGSIRSSQSSIEAPASEVQDKISFIMNNLSDANIVVKAKEIVELLKEEHYPWFAQYIVMKRASIEPNYHALYVKLLDKVNLKALFKEVVRATYENCKVLLQSGLIKSSSEERSLLKNLGSWLGKITIGRDHVLLAREIDPKSLIIEAYEKGLMIAVIPFTSKVLFKNLGVDLKDINPTSLLKERVREFEGNPDFSNKDAGSSQPQFIGDIKFGIVSNLNQGELSVDVASTSHPGHHSQIVPQYAASLHLPSRTLTAEGKLTALVSDQHILPSAQGLLQVETPFSVVSELPTAACNIEEQVIINPKLHDFGLHSHFQSVLPIAMEKAIKDIVMSIMPRSVSIATQTTKELVLKDYSMESDETQIRNASHFMVAGLAGSLVHVACKEALCVYISSQLRNTLEGTDIANEFLEHAVQLVTNDNLELGCALIEQTVIKKAIQTIDETIAIELASMTHKEGHTHIDSYICTEQCKGVLPEALRIKSGHLSYSQQRVYEDFVRLPWKNQSIQSSNALSLGPASSNNSILSQAYVAGSAQMSTAAIYSSDLFKAGVAAVPNYLDIASEEIDTSSSQLHSASLHPIGMGDGASSYNFENDSIVTPFSSVLLRPIKPCNVVKGTGCSIQPRNPTLSSEDLGSSVSELSSEDLGSSVSEPSLTTGDALDKYRIIFEKLENLVTRGAKETEVQGAIAEVPAIILRCKSQDEAALVVAQKVFKGLYENASNFEHVTVHLAMLCSICDISKVVVKELTSWVIYSDEEQKFNKDITVRLIQSDLLSLAEYNIHMAKLIEAERNKSATEFSISLIQTLLKIDSKAVLELQDLVDALGKLAARPGSLESLKQLVEIAKNPSANVVASFGASGWKADNFKQSKGKKAAMLPPSGGDKSSFECVEPGPAGFHEQVSMLFVEWYRICGSPGAKDAASAALYVSQLHCSGLLKGDDVSDCFFQKLMEISVLHCLSSEVISLSLSQASEPKLLSFRAIDLYANLVYSVVKVLAVTVKFILRDSDEKADSFDPRPYFRLFINWIIDLCSSDSIFNGANFQILTLFASAFHALQPLQVPGFSFVWFELVTHRCFMPKLLAGNAQNGWPYFHRLLVDLLQFMEPFLRNAELGEAPVCLLYEETLRVLLIILNDFPEFLCDYHFSFCDVIPSTCIQMRNMVLSACPRNMNLPNPSAPGVKIDLLPEIKLSPRILSEVDAALKTRQLKHDVDEYLKTRQQGSLFLRELKQTLLLSPSEAARAGTHYNVPLINSVVLYVGILAVQQRQMTTRTATSNNNSNSQVLLLANSAPNPSTVLDAAFDIFKTLCMELDKEGRYVLLNAIANQLRYPNNHTHYFSLTILYLFANSNQEMIQEQIIRVILERLVAKPPHPWGLVVTFIELTRVGNASAANCCTLFV
nr:CCR4-NOT transcription complex subunit 1-like [Ipomoea trifida]